MPIVPAHAGAVRFSDAWWGAWNLDPVILLNLALLAWAYAWGAAEMRRRAVGSVSGRQGASFAAALLVVSVALVSPLDPLSDALSSAHMVQHMLLMMVAAPLFVCAAPARVMAWALPPRWRKAIARRRRTADGFSPWYLLWQPLAVWGIFAVTLWIWHLPALYHAALRSRIVHDAQHLTFFAASCLFWRLLFDPLDRLRLGRGLGVLYLFTSSLHASALGVYMALSPRIWYADYEGRTAAWGLTPLQDQQLAGLIMWMPACMVYAAAAAVLFALWLHEGTTASTRMSNDE